MPLFIFHPNHIPRHSNNHSSSSGSNKPINPPTPRLLPEISRPVIFKNPVQQVDDEILAVGRAAVVHRVLLDDLAR